MQKFDGIEHVTGDPVDLSIVWLHGLGADASDFLPIVGELELPAATRFVFPNAPPRPVTINGGQVMRAWFDIAPAANGAVENREQLGDSVAFVRALVERERERGIASERIVLAGFSQGGATVLHAAYGGSEKLGGVLALSAWLPYHDMLPHIDSAAAQMPVLMAHGSADPIIPLAAAEFSAAHLRSLGVAVEFQRYPMAHEVCYDEIRAISAWLARFATR